ncbi:hypothetical protein RBH29_17140 [Herbivorax sp. ANBcel31]|uniref:hypothetical protein n=1 Tax=Herbivorax sp. ANBcel31 TaxID=3069754 RepID=UPI0027B7B6EB|nr:hypothetical protein [Herbivorax sp. ANBcel31]MDQ2088153.1 hypothetical protein [Herbivorax sp. ANBcel31]
MFTTAVAGLKKAGNALICYGNKVGNAAYSRIFIILPPSTEHYFREQYDYYNQG